MSGGGFRVELRVVGWMNVVQQRKRGSSNGNAADTRLFVHVVDGRGKVSARATRPNESKG